MDASVAYFSGGNPAHLAEVLRGTAVCEALLAGLARGMGYAGCSAGVACLTETTYDSDSDDFEAIFKPGLGIVRGILFGPHWDMLDTWVPGATEFIVVVGRPTGRCSSASTSGRRCSATAALAGAWPRSVHVRRDGVFAGYRDGERFDLPLVDRIVAASRPR